MFIYKYPAGVREKGVNIKIPCGMSRKGYNFIDLYVPCEMSRKLVQIFMWTLALEWI